MWWSTSFKNRLIGVSVLLILSSLLWGSVPTLVLGQTGTASPTPTEITLETVIAQTLSARASVTARASGFTKASSTTPDLAKSAEAAISASDTAQAIASFTATPCPSPRPLFLIVSATPSLGKSAVTLTPVPTQATPTATYAATPCKGMAIVIISPTPSDTPSLTWTPLVTTPTATLTGLCPIYSVQAGDTIGAIAEQLGVSLDALLTVNDLTLEDANRLQIGQELIIPVNGCERSSYATATAMRGSANPPTLSATSTPLTSETSSVLEITGVIDPGNSTSEGIEIRNTGGALIRLKGWTLTDGNRHIFEFPNLLLFPNAQITVFTRVGNDTPVAMFWGLSTAVWLPGTTATIRDAQGKIIVQYQVK